jgi:hypothetical protein
MNLASGIIIAETAAIGNVLTKRSRFIHRHDPVHRRRLCARMAANNWPAASRYGSVVRNSNQNRKAKEATCPTPLPISSSCPA